VAHHILDWYIQIEPKAFSRTAEPRKNAAYILYILRDHNAQATNGDIFMLYDNKELSKFGGWKVSGDFSSVDYRMTNPILSRVGDRDLLLIDARKAKSSRQTENSIAELLHDNIDGINHEPVLTINLILKKREEIEQEIMDMLKITNSAFSLQDVKNAIFESEDTDDVMKIVAMFDRGGDSSELDNILELANDAWNHFPHKALGGISPIEKIFNDKNK
jgi:hypothetical protein